MADCLFEMNEGLLVGVKLAVRMAAGVDGTLVLRLGDALRRQV
jgi:hypothetical protein